MGTFLSDSDSPALQGDLLTAPIIVAVGRGVKDLEGFSLMVKFAEAIRAQVAATRGAADEGWISGKREIGLSGKRVSPELYIGCGVAGANFHTIGMEHSKTIVAVNIDPIARIFELSDIGIVDDVKTCISKIHQGLPHTETPTVSQIIELFDNYSGTKILHGKTTVKES